MLIHSNKILYLLAIAQINMRQTNADCNQILYHQHIICTLCKNT